MQSITLTATIRDDRKLTLDLPDDAPTGEVEIVIRPARRLPEPVNGELTEEEIRRRLKAAGLLAEISIPPDAEEMSDDELDSLFQLAPGEKPISEQIIEDREDRV